MGEEHPAGGFDDRAAAGPQAVESPDNDSVNGGDTPWWKDAGWWADTTNKLSIATGFISAGLGIAGLIFPPAAPVLEALAGGFAISSLALGGLSAVFTGIEHGFASQQFWQSAGSAALGLITFGQSKWIGALGAGEVATKITQFGHDLVSPITGLLGL